MRSDLRAAASGLAFLVLLAACGGGQDPRPDDGAARFYDTMFFRDGRQLAVLTFEGGLSYGFYQSDFTAATYPEYAYAGFFVAQPDPTHAAAVRPGTEFSFEGIEATPIQLELAAASGESVFGKLTSLLTSQVTTFQARESPNSRLLTNPALLSRTYAVQARSPGASFKAAARLDAEGKLSVADGACGLEAQLKPRRLGHVYDVSATLGPGCSLGQGDFSGHAVLSPVTQIVYVLLTASGQRGAMLLLLPEAP